VAERLLGWRLTSRLGDAEVVVEISEVEAYAGEEDPASHAYRGRTARNGSMFGRPGTLYVYRSYGVHWCMNVVVGRTGVARAVLLRGANVVSGETTVVARRGRADNLTDGPGKLTQALAVTGDCDGHHLAEPPLQLSRPRRRPARVGRGPRVGISKAASRPWRFQAGAWQELHSG